MYPPEWQVRLVAHGVRQDLRAGADSVPYPTRRGAFGRVPEARAAILRRAAGTALVGIGERLQGAHRTDPTAEAAGNAVGSVR